MRLRFLIALSLISTLAACSFAGTPGPAKNAIMVEHARAPETPGASTVGAGYMTVHNLSAKPIALLSASSPIAEKVEFHSMTTDNGIMRMRPVTEPISIPAKGEVDFGPAGMHVMLLGLSKPLVANDKVPVTLTFEGNVSVNIELIVEARQTGGAHHH